MSLSEPSPSTAPLLRLLEEAVSRGVTPGASLAWGRLDGSPPATLCAGSTAVAGCELAPRPVTPATVYDLASLTKPLVTALAAMLLVQDGRIGLDDPLSRFLPGWQQGRRGRVRLRHLLAHEAGLVWWLPFFREELLAGGEQQALPVQVQQRRQAVRDRLLALEPEHEPGTTSCYSDPGYLLLGLALEQAAGEPLPLLVARTLAPAWTGELGYVDLQTPEPQTSRLPGPWCTRSALLARAEVAPTERCPWRGRLLQAEVHDENAHFLGGIAPHAGLFGTARSVVQLGLALLATSRGDAGSPLRPETVQAFWQGGSRPGGASWALGWDTPTPGRSSAGQRVSPRAVGHLGFTGTSLWLDPERGAAVALLTNRVHPCRNEERIRQLRPEVHDAVWALLDVGERRPAR